jgi:hypothetical protein
VVLTGSWPTTETLEGGSVVPGLRTGEFGFHSRTRKRPAALVSAATPIDVCPNVCPAAFSKMAASCQNEENRGDIYGKNPDRNVAIFHTQAWPREAALFESRTA